MTHEFIFADGAAATRHCRALGWREYGRAAWRKPDGTVVHLICFLEQLEAVTPGMTVHVVGRPREVLAVLKKRGAVIVHVG